MPRILQHIILALVLLLPAAASAQIREDIPPAECQTGDDRIQVLMVGSYHMSNPGMDQFNLDADDVRTDKRQAEITAVVQRLAEFQPSKVAIEAPYGDSSTAAAFRSFLTGEYELRRSESEQIGFRLAKSMGHENVFAIDARLMLDDAALGPLIGANPDHQERMGTLQQFGEGAMAQMGQWLSEGTIGQMLYRMNRPEMLAQAHWPYVWLFAPIVEGDNYAGADMVGTWYTRNLRIFANLNRVSEAGDRVFIIYGQGHIPILQQLVADSPLFCVVDPLPFLAEED